MYYSNYLKFLTILIGLMFLIYSKSRAQSFMVNAQKGIYHIPSLSNDSLRALVYVNEQHTSRNSILGFTLAHDVNFFEEASMEILSDGIKRWRYSIHAPTAQCLQPVFSTLRIAKGDQFYLYNEDRTFQLGPYTHTSLFSIQDTIALQAVEGSQLTMEYIQCSSSNPDDYSVRLLKIGYYFENLYDRQLQEDNCELYDVNCPIAQGWEKEVRSVVLYTLMRKGGARNVEKIIVGNGVLLNSTTLPQKVYMMTASHVLELAMTGDELYDVSKMPTLVWNEVSPKNVNTLVIYYDFQATKCQGKMDDPNPDKSYVAYGGKIVSFHPNFDYGLVELGSVPPAETMLCYAGWDRTAINFNLSDGPDLMTCIHHPGNEKKEFTKTTLLLSEKNNDFYEVVWQYGITKRGSSGAPLFNEHHRVIGGLNSGTNTCESPFLPEVFFKFSTAWTQGQWNNFLTPGQTNVVTMNTYCPVPVCANNIQDPGEQGVDCGGNCPDICLTSPINIIADAGFPAIGRQHIPVYFTNTSRGFGLAGGSQEYTWDFGDGSTYVSHGDDLQVDHTYASTGTFTITLKACNASNSCNTKVFTSAITIQPAPPAETDFIINGRHWSRGMSPIEVGMNQPVEIIALYPKEDGYRYVWDFDLNRDIPEGASQPSRSNAYGPHQICFKSEGLYSVSLSKYNDLNSSDWTAPTLKVDCINAVRGAGPGKASAQLGVVKLNSTCWTPMGPKPRFEVEVVNSNFPHRVLITGVMYGKVNEQMELDFTGRNITFPFVETFTVDVVHYDGERYTVIDRKKVTVTLYAAPGNAGGEWKVCPGTLVTLGSVTPMSGISYQWSVTPSSALGALNVADIQNPTFATNSIGQYTITLTAREATTGCTSRTTTTVTVAPVVINTSTYESSATGSVALNGSASGGTGIYTYQWFPADYLNQATVAKPLFTSTLQTPSEIQYRVEATDTRGCSGSAIVTTQIARSAPSNLQASSNFTAITLTWADNASNETGYLIQRVIDQSAGFTDLVLLPPNTTTYVDNNVLVGATYFYRVTAIGNLPSRVYSNIVQMSTGPMIQWDEQVLIPNVEIYRGIEVLDGYILVGSRKSGSLINSKDGLVVKIDRCGFVMWYKTFGGDDLDEFMGAAVQPNGEILLVGKTFSGRSGDVSQDKVSTFSKGSDPWVVKINSNGDKLWDKRLGIPAYYGGASGVKWFNDHFIVVGVMVDCSPTCYPSSEAWALKLWPDGNVDWSRVYERNDGQNAMDVVRLNDGTYVLYVDYFGEIETYYDLEGDYLVKLNSDGSLANYKKLNDYQIFSQRAFIPNGIVTARNGGVSIVNQKRGQKEMYLLHFNSNLDFQWEKTFHGGANNKNYNSNISPKVISQLPDGSYVIGGDGLSFRGAQKSDHPRSDNLTGLLNATFGGYGDWWIIKTTEQGDKVWDKTIGGTGGETLHSMFPTADAGLMLIGESYSGVGFDKTSPFSADACAWVVKMAGNEGRNPVITTGTVSLLNYFSGDPIRVPFSASCVDPNRIVLAELSDERGSFTSPTVIGSASSGNAVNGFIPASTRGGNQYRVRVRLSDGRTAQNNNGANITIQNYTVTTGVVSPLIYAPGASIAVPYNVARNFAAGNTFSLQLSDPTGSFTNPTIIGNIQRATGGTINGVLPGNLTASNRYRVRVVASSPVTIGTECTDNISIAPLVTGRLQKSSFTQGERFLVNFTAATSFVEGNAIYVVISDAQGNFPVSTSGAVIGAVLRHTTGTGTISCVIPVNASLGTKYRIRVQSTQPILIGTDNGHDFSIEPSTISTGTPSSFRLIGGSVFSLPFTTQGTFSEYNIFRAELSDAQGGFTDPVVIGTLQQAVSGVISCQLPYLLEGGNHYRVRVVAEYPSKVGEDNGIDLQIATLVTNPLPDIYIAPDMDLEVSFVSCIPFEAENEFLVQLSDETGSFARPYLVGRKAGSLSTSITCKLPSSLIPSSRYRIRVLSSLPGLEGADNGTDLIVSTPGISITAVPSDYGFCAQSQAVTFMSTGSFSHNNVFTVELSDAKGDFYSPMSIGSLASYQTGIAVVPISFNANLPAGNQYRMRVVSSNPYMVSDVSSPISLALPYITSSKPAICSSSPVTLSVNTSENYTYQWYKEGTIIYGSTGRDLIVQQSGYYQVEIFAGDNCKRMSSVYHLAQVDQPSIELNSTQVSPVCANNNQPRDVNFTYLNGFGVDGSGYTVYPAAEKGTAISVQEIKQGDSFRFTLSNVFYNQILSSQVEIGLISQPSSLYAPIEYSVLLSQSQPVKLKHQDVVEDLSFAPSVGSIIVFGRLKNSIVIYFNNVLVKTYEVTTSQPFYIALSYPQGVVLNPEDYKVVSPKPLLFLLNTSEIGYNQQYRWYVNNMEVPGQVEREFLFNNAIPGDMVYAELIQSDAACFTQQVRTSSLIIPSVTPSLGLKLDTTQVIKNCYGKQCNWRNTNLVEEGPDFILRKANPITHNWDAGAASQEILSSGGYVEFVVTETNTARMIGLSDRDVDRLPASIQYGIYLRQDGKFAISENSIQRSSYVTYTSNDRMRIALVNGKVMYFRNDALIYVSQKQNAGALVVDISFYSANATIKQLRVNSKSETSRIIALPQVEHSSGIYQWYINNRPVTVEEYISHHEVLETDHLRPGDRIKVSLLTPYGCEIVSSEEFVVSPIKRVNAGEDVAICQGQQVQLNGSGQAMRYYWGNLASLSNTTVINPIVNPLSTQVYTLEATHADGCVTRDEVKVTVHLKPIFDLGADVTICSDGVASLRGPSLSSLQYQWSPTTGLSSSTIGSPLASPSVNTTYTLTATNSFGCVTTDQIKVSLTSNCQLPFFDTPNQRVTIPHHHAYNRGTGDFTIEVLARFSSGTGGRQNILLSKRNTSVSPITGFVFSHDNNRLCFRIGTTDYYSSSFTNIYDGQCHHICVRRNGTILTFLVDGIERGIVNGVTGSIDADTPLVIGNDPLRLLGLKAGVSEVRLWDKSMSTAYLSSNIGTLYNSSTAGLIGYWRFRQMNTQVVPDQSAFRNDGFYGLSEAVEISDPSPTVNTCGILRNPENPTNILNGVRFRQYVGNWNTLPNFNQLTPVTSGIFNTFSASPVSGLTDQYGLSYEGYIEVPLDGYYTFFTNSDDGSQLYIGNTLVVDNDGIHSLVEQSGVIGLKTGRHLIRVVYFEQTGGNILNVSWRGPGISKQFIPSNLLFYSISAQRSVFTDEYSDKPLIDIYPNPYSFSFNLYAQYKRFDECTVVVYNIYGVKMLEQVVKTELINTIQTDLPAGVYLIEVRFGLESFISKVQKIN